MTKSQNLFLRTGFRLIVAALVGEICVLGALAAQPSTKPVNATAKNAARIDVNSADVQTLETLPGVGPATAKRIVEGRPFKNLSDLEKVKGLSKTKVEALKDKVTFGAVSATKVTPASKPSKAKQPTASSVSTGAATASSGPTVKEASGSGGTKSTTTKAADKLAPGQQLNINTASAADLEKLPGIGPTKAQAIVDYRTQNGDFKSIEDIQKVRGIKAGVFSKIKDHLKLSD